MITVNIRKTSLALICAMAFSTQTAMASNSDSLHANTSEFRVAFINRLTPIIQKENEKILQERRFVEDFFKRYDNDSKNLDSSSFNFLLALAKRYKIADILDKTEYLEKIDEIPISLAVSQAILESGWGESSVSKNSQNYFGQRKFKSRNDLESVNYAKFSNAQEAARSYMQNLNANAAYKEFRIQRLSYSKNGKSFSGQVAAKTLKNYSEDGKLYIKMLSQIISRHLALLEGSKNERQSVRAYL